MTTFAERRQNLDLDASWTALKWDASDEFKGSMETALHQLSDGLKAADVVGVRTLQRRPRTLLVAEFKDFDHPNIPAGQRAQRARQAVSDELMRNIVRKVIDTLSGATFAHDNGHQRCAELDAWRPALGRSTTALLVLICIEVPSTQQIAVLAWSKRLQQRLRWLGPKANVIVTSSARPFHGHGVRYWV